MRYASCQIGRGRGAHLRYAADGGSGRGKLDSEHASGRSNSGRSNGSASVQTARPELDWPGWDAGQSRTIAGRDPATPRSGTPCTANAPAGRKDGEFKRECAGEHAPESTARFRLSRDDEMRSRLKTSARGGARGGAGGAPRGPGTASIGTQRRRPRCAWRGTLHRVNQSFKGGRRVGGWGGAGYTGYEAGGGRSEGGKRDAHTAS